MLSSSAYPTYATASLSATSQLSSLPSMTPMSAATIPAIPNTSTNLASAFPRTASITANLPSTQPFGSVVSAFPTQALPNYSQNSTGARFVGASTPSVLGIQAAPLASSASIQATLPMSYSNSFAKPTYTTPAYNSGYTTPAYNSGYAYGSLPQAGSIQAGSIGGNMQFGGNVEYIPNDHHEVEDFYHQYDQALDRSHLLLFPKPQQSQPQPQPHWRPEPPMPAPPMPPAPEPHHATGFVGRMKEKVMDVVHGVEDKVSNVVHGVEHAVEEKVHAVEEKVHAVEEKVSNAVHAVHDKVSGFFGMLGGLFHKKHSGEGKGPHGHEIGKGSTVEVTLEDGTTQRGHVVEHGDDVHVIQLHTSPPGQYHAVPVGIVSHVTDFAPIVGAGVEVLYDGVWYPGHVCALPMEGDARPLYTVACHGDEEGQVTYADDASIRPLLSPEERMVVSGHMQAISQQLEAEKAAAALQQKAADEAMRKSFFKQKMDNAGLTVFYPSFVGHGYDTEDALAHMHDGEMETFGMKAGHVAKFYQAFPRGSPYVLSNVHLKSTAMGISFRRTKDLTDDSHRIAPFAEVLYGTEQEDGWLKVGNMYIPMEIGGKRVVFMQGMVPTEEAGQDEETEDKPQGIVAKVEDKVKSGLHEFAHMLHFG